MAYAITSTRGPCRAEWADNIRKVVVDVDSTGLSMHLSADEAAALAVQLTAAVDQSARQ